MPGRLIRTLYACLRPNDGLKNLILLTAPLDFTDKTAGGFTRWVSHPAFDPDKLVDAFGNVPGRNDRLRRQDAQTGRELSSAAYLNLWDNIDDPGRTEAWHAMNTWVRDIIPMSGGAYRQLINEFYKENRLIEGTLTLRGERVELGNLRANLLNVIAEADHITPPCQSEGVMDLVASQDKEVFRVKGGHIGIMAGRGAEKTTWPHINEWLTNRAG